jgi:XRE family transcriptional regulator, regulator of sulfur utilization
VLKRLGQNISIIRKRNKIPLEKFAWDIEVARSYLYKIEQGEANPTMDIIIKIAKGLNVKVKELINF